MAGSIKNEIPMDNFTKKEKKTMPMADLLERQSMATLTMKG